MRHPQQALALLGRAGLFSGLLPGDLDALLTDLKSRRFGPGSYIALSRFAALGLVKVERGNITLLQPEELRRRSL